MCKDYSTNKKIQPAIIGLEIRLVVPLISYIYFVVKINE